MAAETQTHENVQMGKGLTRLTNLIDYYFEKGGMQMQFNVVSRETLERAQKDPNKYPLPHCPRSGLFCLLCRTRQDGSAGYHRTHRRTFIGKSIVTGGLADSFRSTL